MDRNGGICGRRPNLPSGLCWPEINANDLGAWVVVTKFDSPNARSAADVEDFTARIVNSGRQVIFAAETNADHLMDHVKAVTLALNGSGSKVREALSWRMGMRVHRH